MTLMMFILTLFVPIFPFLPKPAEAADEVAFKYYGSGCGVYAWKVGNEWRLQDMEGSVHNGREGAGAIFFDDVFVISDYEWPQDYGYKGTTSATGMFNGAIPNQKDPDKGSFTPMKVTDSHGGPKGHLFKDAFDRGELGTWGSRKVEKAVSGNLTVRGTLSVPKATLEYSSPTKKINVTAGIILTFVHNKFNLTTGEWGEGGASGDGGELDPEPEPQCEWGGWMFQDVETRFLKDDISYKDILSGAPLAVEATSTIDCSWSLHGTRLFTGYTSEYTNKDLLNLDKIEKPFRKSGKEIMATHSEGLDLGKYENDPPSMTGTFYVNTDSKWLDGTANLGMDFIHASNCSEVDGVPNPVVKAYQYFSLKIDPRNKPPTAQGTIRSADGITQDTFWRYTVLQFKDNSIDPEDDLMDRQYVLQVKTEDGTWANIAKVNQTRSTGGHANWTSAASEVNATYVENVSGNNFGFDFTILKMGEYRVQQKVGDVNNIAAVTQLWDTNEDDDAIHFIVDKDPSPPQAKFDFYLMNKVTKSAFAGADVELINVSDDPDDDIVSHKWEIKYTDPVGGSLNLGDLAQWNTTLTGNVEGQVQAKLTVTDRGGRTGTLTKTLRITPPIPVPGPVIIDPDDPDKDMDGDGQPGENIEDGGTYDKPWMKENRKISFNLNNSIAPPKDPIFWDKTKWVVKDSKGNVIGTDKAPYVESADYKSRDYLFREKGKYTIEVTLANAYTEANPGKDLSSATIKFKINIKEDKKPKAVVEVTGNSANFIDNPVKTTVNVKDMSISEDADFIKDGLNLTGLSADQFFGRGKNAYDWKIILDANDDGKFDTATGDKIIYDSRDGNREFTFNVPFTPNTKGKYKAFFTARETFGQRTIPQFVTNADRRTATLEKDFTVNWVPWMEYKFKDDVVWQGDDFSFTTNIKDERPATCTIEWSVKELRIGSDYGYMHIPTNTFVPLDIWNALPNLPTGEKDVTGTEYPVGNYNAWPIDTEYDIKWSDVCDTSPGPNGGTLNFKRAGKFRVYATIVDEVGQKYTTSADIRVAPIPDVALEDDPATRWQMLWQAKQNRIFTVHGSGSVTDPYLKLNWWFVLPDEFPLPEEVRGSSLKADTNNIEIVPLDGQPVDGNIFVAPTGTQAKIASTSSTIFKANKVDDDLDLMFKQGGRYKIRWQVSNEAGKVSKWTERTITVVLDEAPKLSFEIDQVVNRDPSNANRVDINLYNIMSSSPDADTISTTVLQYRHDSDNDGSFDDEIWKAGPAITKDPASGKQVAVITDTQLGKYQVRMYIKETFGQSTMDRYIVAKDYLDAEVIQIAECDNQAPKVDLSAMKGHKVDIVVATGNVDETMLTGLSNKVETHIINLLKANGAAVVDSKLQLVETSSTSMSDEGAKEIFNRWKKYPEYGVNGSNLSATDVWELDEPNGAIKAVGVRARMGTHGNVAIVDTESYNTTDFTLEFKYTAAPICANGTDNSLSKYSRHLAGPIFRYNEDPITGATSYYMLAIGDSGTSYNDQSNIGAISLVRVDNGYANWFPVTYTEHQAMSWCGGPLYSSTVPSAFHHGHTNQTIPLGTRIRVTPSAQGYTTNLGSKVLVNQSSTDFKLEVKGNNIKVYCGDTLEMDITDTYSKPNGVSYDKGAYGFCSLSSPDISFSNIKITSKVQKSLADILRGDVVWRDGAARVVVNIDNGELIPSTVYEPEYAMVPELRIQRSSACQTYGGAGSSSNSCRECIVAGYHERCPICSGHCDASCNSGCCAGSRVFPTGRQVLGKTGNYLPKTVYDYTAKSDTEIAKLSALLVEQNIAYVSLNGSYNQGDENKIITGITDGTSIRNDAPNIDTALQKAGTWILNLINSKNQGDVKYILLNDLITYNKLYADFENDPQYVPYSKWYYEHDPDFFENSLGIHDKSNQWLDGSINSFDRTGKYLVTWQTKDDPTKGNENFAEYRKLSSMVNGPLQVLVHRKPIANFTPTIQKRADKFTVSYADYSYDLDHQSEPNKGLSERKWSWKEVNDSNWTVGKRTEFPTTKEFLVKLEVRDIDGAGGVGEWSEPQVIFLSTAAQPPVAKFTWSPTQLPLGSEIQLMDTSFDPNGDLIVEHRWVLTKDGTKIGTFPIVNNSGITAAQVENVRIQIKQAVEGQGHNAYGSWKLTLQVRDNTGVWGDPKATSEIFMQNFVVKPNNRPPDIEIDTGNGGSIPSGDDDFVDGITPGQDIGTAQSIGYKRNVYVDAVTTDGAVTNSPFKSHRNYLNIPLDLRIKVTDKDAMGPFPNNSGFSWKWEFIHHDSGSGRLSDTSMMTNEDKVTVKNFGPKDTEENTLVPFTNSAKAQGMAPGPYEVRTTITDKPLYGTAQSASVEQKIYIVPNLTGTITVTPEGTDLIVGEDATIRVVTDKWTDKVELTLDRTFVTNNPWSNTPGIGAEHKYIDVPFKEKNGDSYIYEMDYTLPELSDSGDYYFTARLATTAGSKDVYGVPDKVTRYGFIAAKHYITALKIVDVVIKDMDKHPQYDGMFPIITPDMPVDYTTGYYVYYEIVTKGDPDRVSADVTINGVVVDTIEFEKIANEDGTQTWIGKWAGDPYLENGTEIFIDPVAERGTSSYDYCDKEAWDGHTLTVTGSAMEDAVINRTN